MTYIFKGMELVLTSGKIVHFDTFFYTDETKLTKAGFYDTDGNTYPMYELDERYKVTNPKTHQDNSILNN